jgi:FKBP-type peptidyl-prolyl cis-trans isomerase FkpA/FKBP-type peptidyl-prolyl cis-trans isomerase FklB
MKPKSRKLVQLLAVASLAAGVLARAEVELKSEDDKALYAAGLLLSANVTVLRLSEAELEILKAGLTDGALHRGPKVDVEAYRTKLQELIQKRAQVAADEAKAAGKAFLDKAVAEEGVRRTTSGLGFKMIAEGSGASPGATDTVKVHYTGALIDGTVFDSSVQRGQPASFALNGVIPCWTEGLQLMKVGGKAKLYCPSEIAYGDRGRPKIPPGATLVFDVELLDVTKREAKPQTNEQSKN